VHCISLAKHVGPLVITTVSVPDMIDMQSYLIDLIAQMIHRLYVNHQNALSKDQSCEP
jgi:hypothetical protein